MGEGNLEEFWMGEDADECWMQPVFGPDRDESDDELLPKRGIVRATVTDDLYARYCMAMDAWAGVQYEISERIKALRPSSPRPVEERK